MINKIHPNVREAISNFIKNKQVCFADRSSNTIVLISKDLNFFQEVEQFVKKELLTDISSIETKFPYILTETKEHFFELNKVKYKLKLHKDEHFNNTSSLLFMLTVSY